MDEVKSIKSMIYSYVGPNEVKNLCETIEALQKENDNWQEKYYELDAGHSRLFKDFCKLQQKNEQLKAQVARIPDICKWWDGWSCTAYQSDEMKCPHCCPNWEGDNKYAVYHNPADADAAIELWRHKQQIRDALAEIDKTGGKEDV